MSLIFFLHSSYALYPELKYQQTLLKLNMGCDLPGKITLLHWAQKPYWHVS